MFERGRLLELDLPSFDGDGLPGTTGTSAVAPPLTGADEKGPETESAPFVLNSVLPVVPARLVKRILKGDFVDMAELLRDNLEAERRRARSELETGKSGAPASSRREVPDFTSWVQCFALYASVVQSRYPSKGRDLWAYLGVIASEFRRVGGSGWRLYDAAFRQQFASMEAADFGTVDTTLFATTFLTYRRSVQGCSGCLSSGQDNEECSGGRPSRLADAGRGHREPARWAEQGYKRRRKGACCAWNDGRCHSSSCRFEHVCSRCHGDHKRPMCSSGEIARESGSGQAGHGGN